MQHLQLTGVPQLSQATLLLALAGWMDGGLVSTGTVRRVMERREVRDFATIDPEPFYVFNLPGNMEVASAFRPEVEMTGGIIQKAPVFPSNAFHVDEAANLIFFLGQEPHLRWQTFADCLFEVCRQAGVMRIIFMGSFGGSVPHTRQPRMYGSVSHEHLLPMLTEHGLRPSDYEGPASISTLLLAQCPAHQIEMLSLVAEIPGYLDGINPMSIEAVTRLLAKLLNQPVDLESLREASTAWEMKVTEAVEKNEELAETVHKLEEQYDTELLEQEGE